MSHPSARKRKNSGLFTASLGAAALIFSASTASAAQDSPDAQSSETIISQSTTNSESISVTSVDGKVTIVKNGKQLSEEETKAYLEQNGDGHHRIRIHQGTSPTEVQSKKVVILKSAGDHPDATAFAQEMRRLAEDPVANADAMTALAEDFETRMRSWQDAHVRDIDVQDEEFVWHSKDGETACGEGAQIRTVIVKKDDETGTESRTENIECGDAGSIDSDAILADLRKNADLTEERLAEVKKQLDEAKGQLGERRIRVEIEEDGN